MKHEPETHARNTLCDLIDTNEAELHKLRGIASTLHRQRNELLQQMRLILAATQNWNGGWVGKGQSAEDVITYIAQMAGSALAEVGRNGQ